MPDQPGARADDNSPLGLVEGLSNDDYHAGPGVSKSMLDLVHASPALLEWSARAPVDPEAEAAADLGNAFEAILLEPDRFNARYAVAPDVDGRTTAGKAAMAEFHAEVGDRVVLNADQVDELELMAESAWAHPMARRVLEASQIIQGSYYWTDPVTDALCRCRPDLLCTDLPMVVDCKLTANIGRFIRSAAEFRYHVQDAFYSDGLAHYYGGEQPHFLFLAVCTDHALKRFPVHLMEFDIDAKHQGVNEYRADLERYLQCVESGDFTDIEELHLPAWARANTDL